LVELAGAYIALGQREQAEPLLSKALDLALILGDEELDSEVARSLSVNYAAVGDFREALQLAWAIKPRASSEMTLKYSALAEIADKYVEFGEVEKASELLSQALEAARELRNAPQNSKGLSILADQYAILGDGKQAQILLSEALELAKEARVSRSKSEALARVVVSYSNVGELDEAFKITREMAADRARSTALRKLVGEYAKAGDFDQALVIVENMESPSSQAGALVDIANKHVSAGNKNEAIPLLRRAHKITLQDTSVSSYNLASIAGAFARIDDDKRAQQILLEALKHARSEQDAADKSYSFVLVAGVYSGLGREGRALELLAEAHEIVNDIEGTWLKSMELCYLAETYAMRGDFKKAFIITQSLDALKPKDGEYYDEPNDAALWQAFALETIVGIVLELSEENADTLFEVTHAMQPISELLMNNRIDNKVVGAN